MSEEYYLNPDLWIKISFFAQDLVINKLRVINKTLNTILSSKYFCKMKFLNDYRINDWNKDENNDEISNVDIFDWKEACLNYGNIFVAGNNCYNQLGLGDFEDRDIPTLIPEYVAKKIVIGSHSAFITVTNELFMMGLNDYGQLCLNDENFRGIPFKIGGIKAQDVALGLSHTVILDDKGQVWGAGSNSDSQLAAGALVSFSKIAKIGNIKCNKITAGFRHTVICDTENKLWSAGHNRYKLLDNGENFATFGNFASFSSFIPTKMSGKINVKHLYAKYNFTSVIDDEDNLHFRGQDIMGEPNDWTLIPNFKVKQIVGGRLYRAILTTENDVWIQGLHISGQFNLTRDKSVFYYIGTHINLEFVKLEKLKAKQIAGGNHHLVILTTENDVLVMGENYYGQLGLGDRLDRYHLTKIPNFKAKQVAAGGDCTAFIV